MFFSFILIYVSCLITDCFQFTTLLTIPDVGVHLIHMLGAIISGSQVGI